MSIQRTGLVAAAIIAMVGLGALGCARPGPGSAKSTDELLTQLKEDRTEIDQTSDTMMKRIEVLTPPASPGSRRCSSARSSPRI